ncbi:MAG: hypothetical protein WC205_11360 [Opitutaceae bacterium]|jgi:hypothetical protein
MKTRTITAAFIAMILSGVSVFADIYRYDDKVANWRDARFEPLLNIQDGRPAESLFVGEDRNRVAVGVRNRDGSPGILSPGTYAGFVWNARPGERIVKVSFVYSSVLKPGLELSIFSRKGEVLEELHRIKPEKVVDNRASTQRQRVELDLKGRIVARLEFRMWELPAGHVPSTSVSPNWESVITALEVETVQVP